MIPFHAPQEDILFSLKHVAQAGSLPCWDEQSATAIVQHFSSLAEQTLAPLNAAGDLQGARLKDGRVIMPDGFEDAYHQLADDGWQGLTAPEEFGGSAVSATIACAVSEIFSGANHALQMICNLVPGAIRTLLEFGSDDQQQAWIPRLSSGEALCTMCLTEPSAGSDLSAIRCAAVCHEGNWSINGEKIFISGGDQNLSHKILHLVLARTGDEAEGIRGLSLFLCPAQAGVSVLRLEDKLGLHASPTCHLRFDNASAELIGEQGGGLKAMFRLMNHARLDVALQGVAHAARASHIATQYAAGRRQGRTADGRSAMLDQHADVSRMLDEQKRLALGARAMCHIASVELDRGARPALVEFLTPLCKFFSSEAGITSADLGIQVLGGYGYLREYGIEQIWRDARITAIYEGANGIHRRTLVTRGLKDELACQQFADLIGELAQTNGSVLRELQNWQHLADRVRGLNDPTTEAYDFAEATARVYFHAVWARIVAVSDQHSNSADLKRLSQHLFS